MTLKETKDKVSQSLGYDDWKELVKDQSNFTDAGFNLIVSNVAKLSSTEKVKEAVDVIADKAERDNTGTLNCVDIRQCEAELLETINKEI